LACGRRVRAPISRCAASDPRAFLAEVWTREELWLSQSPEIFSTLSREVVHQGLVDIMLMSAYVNEQLAIKGRVVPQIPRDPPRGANDTTDVWAVRHGCYTREPAQPFRTATIDQIQCGKIECDRTTDEFPGANLGLYSSRSSTTWSRTAKRCSPSRSSARG